MKNVTFFLTARNARRPIVVGQATADGEIVAAVRFPVEPAFSGVPLDPADYRGPPGVPAYRVGVVVRAPSTPDECALVANYRSPAPGAL